DRPHRACLSPQRCDLDERASRIHRIEPDAVMAMLEQKLTATAEIGVDDVDCRDPQRGTLAYEHIADDLGLTRAHTNATGIGRVALERVKAATLAHPAREEFAQQRFVVVVLEDEAQALERLRLARPAEALAVLLLGRGRDPHDLAQELGADVVRVY